MADIRTLVRNEGPLWVFAGLTVGGMIFVWTAKMLAWNALTVMIVPILLMCIYFALCSLSQGLRLHNEQAGDNLYYMGFLFTLTSLGVSLYRFTGGVAIDEIVRNFGIAVSSTICGVTFRILFNQMRRDPLDIERTVRHELAEMTRRIKSELDTSAREFSNYRRTSNQMLSEGFDEIARQAERNGAAILKTIESMSKDAIRPIQEAAQQLAAISEANNKIVDSRAKANSELAATALSRLDDTSKRMVDAVTKFGDQVEVTGNRLSTMKLPDEVLRIDLQPVLAAVTSLGELQAKRLDESAKHNELQADRLKTALEPLEKVPVRLDDVLRPLNDLPNRMDASLKIVDGLGKKIETALKPLAVTSANIGQTVDLLDEAAKRVEDSANRVEDSSKRVNDSAHRVDDSSKRVEGSSKRVEDSAKSLPVYVEPPTAAAGPTEKDYTHGLLNSEPAKGEAIELRRAAPERMTQEPYFLTSQGPEPAAQVPDEGNGSDTDDKRKWKWPL